jgi:hypothetical protein
LRSCLGLSLSQGFGHDPHRAPRGHVPARVIGPRPVVAARIGGAPTHPLVGFGTSFPSRPAPAERPLTANRPRDGVQQPSARRPALQRFRGADASLLRRRALARAAAAPCMRFAHRP